MVKIHDMYHPHTKVITGEIIDATHSTITMDADGTAYSFVRDDDLIEHDDAGILLGDEMQVSYLGDLDPTLSVQTVEVKKIVIVSKTASVTPIPEETPVPTQTPTENPTIEPTIEPTIAPTPTPEPVDPKHEKIMSIINGMTLEEKVGQLFITRCPTDNGVEVINQYQPGGYIMFGVDFQNRDPESVRSVISSYQENSKVPMFIGVDEEGGTVTRVSYYSQYGHERFKSPQTLFAQGGLDLIAQDTIDKCIFLKDLGINLNFAPVADVSTNSSDFMYQRAFGRDGYLTAQYVDTVVTQMKMNQIGSVLKHFPGYGNNADTHTGIAYDNRDYDTFVNSDFLPFSAGIEAGADVVLVSHNIVACMDGERPASISPRVHEILREELGFEGVIVTDDLYMNGVRDYADEASIAIMAIQAGNDLLCCTDYQTQIPAVIQAVYDGTITEERLEESIYRILSMKIDLGLISLE